MHEENYDELRAERDRLRRYIVAARPLIERHDPSLHVAIQADPMWLTDDARLLRVPLRGRGGTVRAFAIVDERDAWVSSLKWSLSGKGYASAGTGKFMHRMLLGLQPGDRRQADHINGDPLDNRRINLRIVSPAENRQNTVGSAAYRGIRFRPHRNKWEARGWQDGRTIHLGHFATAEEADSAVRKWRREHMPFANEARHPSPNEAQRGANEGAR